MRQHADDDAAAVERRNRQQIEHAEHHVQTHAETCHHRERLRDLEAGFDHPRIRARVNHRRQQREQHTADLIRHLSFKRLREFLRRLADQIGLADAWKELRQADDAAGLGLAAGDPEDVGKTGQRLGGRIGIGRL